MSTSSTTQHAGHHDSPEEIRKSLRKYWTIGGVLYVLTVVTVILGFIEMPTVPAIILGMAVAVTKASLVALFFMHLIDEKKLIYYTLLLTVTFFVVCMLVPTFTDAEADTHRTIYEDTSGQHLMIKSGGDHGAGHGDAHGGEHKTDGHH